MQLILPPFAETAVTGYVMGANKRIGKTNWRLEVYRGETLPRVYRNNVRQASIADCPPAALKFWTQFKVSPALQYALTA